MASSSRPRNYALEYARRNEKAQKAGFRSYAAQRKAKEKVARPRGGKPRDYKAEYARRKALKADRLGRFTRLVGHRPLFHADNVAARLATNSPAQMRRIDSYSDAEFADNALISFREAARIGIVKDKLLYYH